MFEMSLAIIEPKENFSCLISYSDPCLVVDPEWLLFCIQAQV